MMNQRIQTRNAWSAGYGVFTLCLLSALITPAEARQDNVVKLDRGATLRVYSIQQEPTAIPELAEGQTPNADVLVPVINERGGEGFAGVPSPIYVTVTGWIEAPRDGIYRFRLSSDDGSRLILNGAEIVDNDGRHGERPRDSAPIELSAGLHPFLIEFFDYAGQRVLRLEWQTPDQSGAIPADRTFALVPEGALWAERDLTRVTSPGYKRLTDGLRAGDGLPLTGVHPSWEVQTIRPEGFEPMVGAMTFLPDGRLVVGTFFPLQRDERELPDIESKVPDKLYALSNVQTGDPAQITVEVIADGLYEPMGLCVVEGDLYVSHRREISRLRDLDGDGFFETHEHVASGWEAWNYHQFTRGLVHLDGRLYATLTTTMAPPAWEGMETNSAPSGPMRGGILEVELATGDVRVIAGGTRTPNGIGLGPDGALFYTDNQGTWMPVNQISEVIPGRFYGHYNWTRFVPRLAERYPDGGFPSAYSDRPRTPATILMPQGEAANSPTDPLLIEDGIFAGQLLVGELTAGGIRRVFLERVNGELQGALFRFTQGLEAGVNRLIRGPDGALYIGGMGAGGNWNWRGTTYGLQRLAPTGVTAFEMHSIRAMPDGFEVTFTKPVDPDWLTDPANYHVQQWTYRPTAAYGGPKFDVESLEVTAAVPSEDGTQVRLTIPGLKEGHCVHLRTDPVSVEGEEIWSAEAWYTLNAIPRAEPAKPSTIAGTPIDAEQIGVGVGVLPPAHAVPLISQTALNTMRYDRQQGTPAMLSQNDLINAPGYIEVGAGSGDLVTPTVFGDAHIHVEWYCPPGGEGQMAANSGVYLQNRYEIQILGTPSGAPPRTNEAGAIYNQRAPETNASTGPGTWQAYDIFFRAPRFEDGVKTANARLTLYWNGVLVHDDVAIERPTGAAAARGEDASRPMQLGPLRLQDHASQAEGPVRFRNVWIAPLEETTHQPGPWLDLLDESVTRWEPRGGEATFRVEDGEVIGTARPGTPNTFLTTTETFGDFELVYDAWTHPRLNSGVQIRSEVIGGFDNREGLLRGYQVELDPSERAFSGGIYDERRRAWIHPLFGTPHARRAFRPGAWNRFHVIVCGPVIRTWINGIPVADMFDAMDAAGHIGLQVHSIAGDEADTLEVRFRHLRLRRLTPLSGQDHP